ncbi:hypothetical protein ABWI01_03520 [Oceanicaulis alexandrii]|uniref:hypothetical protein n=1 Tax=Oceanicaulis alexandrii TaxID=153233 RepID=UPI0035CFE485
MQNDRSGPLIPLGALVMVGGMIWLGVAYVAPAGLAYSGTINYEMLQMKTLHAIGGAACIVAGSVWTAAGIVLHGLTRAPGEVNTPAATDLSADRVDSES